MLISEYLRRFSHRILREVGLESGVVGEIIWGVCFNGFGFDLEESVLAFRCGLDDCFLVQSRLFFCRFLLGL